MVHMLFLDNTSPPLKRKIYSNMYFFNISYTSVFSFIGACFFNQRSCLRYFNANFSPVNLTAYIANASADPEGGGTGGPDPPGKSQVIWVS